MWFVFALLCTFFWGLADLFYKKGSDAKDTNTHLRIAIAVGFVMGIHGFIYWALNPDIGFTPLHIFTYLPVSFFYIVSMIAGYFGLRYLGLSISSPIQNSSGAAVAIMCILFLGDRPGVLSAISIVILCVGVFALSVLEKRDETKARKLAGQTVDKKYQFGFIAIIFPLIYCVLDAMGTFLDDIFLDEANGFLTEDQGLLAYEFTFLIVAIVCFVYMVFVKHEQFFIKREKTRYAAAISETAGQFFYVFIIGGNGVITAPIVSSYCVVSLLLSRILLKEKLSIPKYIAIAVIVCGIVLMGVAEGLAEG